MIYPRPDGVRFLESFGPKALPRRGKAPVFNGAVFPLTRTAFQFAGGLTLATTLNRSCKVAG